MKTLKFCGHKSLIDVILISHILNNKIYGKRFALSIVINTVLINFSCKNHIFKNFQNI